MKRKESDKPRMPFTLQTLQFSPYSSHVMKKTALDLLRGCKEKGHADT
jgi:hypothetical protein